MVYGLRDYMAFGFVLGLGRVAAATRHCTLHQSLGAVTSYIPWALSWRLSAAFNCILVAPTCSFNSFRCIGQILHCNMDSSNIGSSCCMLVGTASESTITPETLFSKASRILQGIRRALIIRTGFGAHYAINTTRSPQK